MHYIIGEDQPGMRSRTVFVDTNGDTTPDQSGTWRLGDIIYSTPAVVSRPMENFDDIYSDPTYDEFERHYTRGTGAEILSRPTVVYVGGNDGMLHAINAGVYKAGDERTTGTVEHGRYTTDYPAYFTAALGHAPELGEEIWTYIPHNLLPHLQWLSDPNYTHVYYVDQKPKIVDARIFPDDMSHPGGWGTVLIGGLRYGGKDYEVDDMDQDGVADDPETFSSCYFALDITNPGSPRLLWEFNDPDHLGLTSSYPAVARVGRADERGDWYVIFGSGPTDYDGTSDQMASGFVLNLLTGNLERRFGANPGGDGFPQNPVLEFHGWVGGLASMDMNLDYQTNAIYAGGELRGAGDCYLRQDVPDPDRHAGHGRLSGARELGGLGLGPHETGTADRGPARHCFRPYEHPMGLLGDGPVLQRCGQVNSDDPELLRGQGSDPGSRGRSRGNDLGRAYRRDRRGGDLRSAEHG